LLPNFQFGNQFGTRTNQNEIENLEAKKSLIIFSFIKIPFLCLNSIEYCLLFQFYRKYSIKRRKSNNSLKRYTLMNQYNKNQKKKIEYYLFINKFINFIMFDGKKEKASTIFFKSLDLLNTKLNLQYANNFQKQNTFTGLSASYDKNTLQLLFRALKNVMPSVEVRKVRVAGATYLVPAILSKKKQENLAVRWLIESARKRQNTSRYELAKCLSDELFDAIQGQGLARQKRDELHKVAEANRAYIRYKWW